MYIWLIDDSTGSQKDYCFAHTSQHDLKMIIFVGKVTVDGPVLTIRDAHHICLSA